MYQYRKAKRLAGEKRAVKPDNGRRTRCSFVERKSNSWIDPSTIVRTTTVLASSSTSSSSSTSYYEEPCHAYAMQYRSARVLPIASAGTSTRIIIHDGSSDTYNCKTSISSTITAVQQPAKRRTNLNGPCKSCRWLPVVRKEVGTAALR